MTERRLPHTVEELADEVLRYIAVHRRLFDAHGDVRSVTFTVKFSKGVTPRQRYFTVEAAPKSV